MGWRFRQSVKLFPGVRLNLGLNGISTTIGIPGANVNLGRYGVTANTGMPGTGISNRQRIFSVNASANDGHPVNDSPTDGSNLSQPGDAVADDTPAAIKYESAASTQITSKGLKELRDLVRDAYLESITLQGEIDKQSGAENTASSKLQFWSGNFIFRKLFKNKIETLSETCAKERDHLDELKAQLELCCIKIDHEQAAEFEDQYCKLIETYAGVAKSEMIWDIPQAVALDRVRERSLASTAVNRELVKFDFLKVDFIETQYPPLHLQNHDGGDIFLLPGFALYLRSRTDFALIEYSDFKVDIELVPFVEDRNIPQDAVLSHNTWKYVNKDGSPDKRFANNRQIPVMKYGSLHFKSAAGLNEKFMFSNALAAIDFGKVLAGYQELFLHAKQPVS